MPLFFPPVRMAVALQLINDILPEGYPKAKACIKVIQVQGVITAGVNKKGYPAEIDLTIET